MRRETLGGGEGAHEPQALNERAVRVIRRVVNKLTGREFGEELSVAQQVQCLIEQATSHQHLCTAYIGAPRRLEPAPCPTPTQRGRARVSGASLVRRLVPLLVSDSEKQVTTSVPDFFSVCSASGVYTCCVAKWFAGLHNAIGQGFARFCMHRYLDGI